MTFLEELRVRNYMKKEMPIQTPAGHKEIYSKYHKAMCNLNSEINIKNSCKLTNLLYEIMVKDELPVWDVCVMQTHLVDKNCVDIFELKNVIDYMDRTTTEETLLAFEEAGRPICQEIIDQWYKDPTNKRLQDLAGCAIDTGRTLYDYFDNRSDFAVKAFMLWGNSKVEVARLCAEYKTLDEVPSLYIYRAWQGANKEKWPNSLDIRSYMLTREPEDEESKTILEAYNEKMRARER